MTEELILLMKHGYNTSDIKPVFLYLRDGMMILSIEYIYKENPMNKP